MSDLDLDAIEARVNAATPGPWACWDGWPVAHMDDGDEWRGIERIGPESPIDGGLLGSLDRRPEGRSHDLFARRADAEFVAHARTDVPALLAEVRRLREALENSVSRPMPGLADLQVRYIRALPKGCVFAHPDTFGAHGAELIAAFNASYRTSEKS